MSTIEASKKTLRRGLASGAAALAGACAIALACLGATGCSTSTATYEGTSTDTSEGIVAVHDYVGAEVDDTVSWIKSNVYDVDAQQAVADELEASKDGQTIDDPLVAYNPFGTNTQSLYVYFTSDDECSVTYTVSVSDEEAATIEDETFTADSIADFTRDVNDGGSTTEHEFQVIGLIPSVTNTVTLTASYADGSTETNSIEVEMCDLLGDEELQVAVTDGDSDAELSDGLYVILGNDDGNVDFMYYYDNDGIIRGEVPLIEYRSHRLLFDDEDTAYFSIDYGDMAAMSSLGQILNVYDLGDYSIHHDYAFNADGDLLILANDTTDDTVEDRIITVDVETGEVSLTIDLGDLFPTFEESSVEYHNANATEDAYEGGVDWIHINAIQYIGDDQILLSSRETSTIIKISDIYGEPTLDYLIGSEEYWAGTDYADYVYEKIGDFTIQGGQHSITYVEDDSLEEGQYYIYMFNNNIGLSYDTTTDFDYSSIGLTNTDWADEDAVSYYYEYLVDENAGTFELVDSFEVPYSGYVSSVQEVGTNMLIDSGDLGVWTEYDENHNAIRTFTMEDEYFIYRVYKYDL